MNPRELERENHRLKIRVARLEAQLESVISQKVEEGSVVIPRSLYREMRQRDQDEVNRAKAHAAQAIGHPMVEFIGFGATTQSFMMGSWMLGELYEVVPNTLTLYTPSFTPGDPATAPDFVVMDMVGRRVQEELTAFRPVNDEARIIYRKAGFKEV